MKVHKSLLKKSNQYNLYANLEARAARLERAAYNLETVLGSGSHGRSTFNVYNIRSKIYTTSYLNQVYDQR